MARPVIVFSTPTSATGSLFRTVTAIAEGHWPPLKWINALRRAGRSAALGTDAPPAEGFIIE